MIRFTVLISGSIYWETILEGRIEGSAMVVGDFSQVSFLIKLYRSLYPF